MKKIDQKSPFLLRFIQYQKERFPFLFNGIVIGVFSFSAISYSILSRGEQGFVDWGYFIPIAIQTLFFFFLVRIFDEFKDHEDDKNTGLTFLFQEDLFH